MSTASNQQVFRHSIHSTNWLVYQRNSVCRVMGMIEVIFMQSHHKVTKSLEHNPRVIHQSIHFVKKHRSIWISIHTKRKKECSHGITLAAIRTLLIARNKQYTPFPFEIAGEVEMGNHAEQVSSALPFVSFKHILLLQSPFSPGGTVSIYKQPSSG